MTAEPVPAPSARPGMRLSLVVAVLSALVFVVVAAVLIPWHWLPGQHVHAVPARSVFTAAQIAHDQHVAWL
ncbi:MAG TPA: hypothetical protein VFE15_02885, partial [Marmoricola sp.]|nr:hypothetical protein [Marmoricola sp.]